MVVKVIVLEKIDTKPKFEKSQYSVNVREDVVVNHRLIKVSFFNNFIRTQSRYFQVQNMRIKVIMMNYCCSINDIQHSRILKIQQKSLVKTSLISNLETSRNIKNEVVLTAFCILLKKIFKENFIFVRFCEWK